MNFAFVDLISDYMFRQNVGTDERTLVVYNFVYANTAYLKSSGIGFPLVTRCARYNYIM